MTNLTLWKAFIVGTLFASSIGVLASSTAFAQQACQDRVAALKARIDNAPVAWDTAKAKAHYQAAEKALASKDEEQCLKAVDATQQSLKDAESAALEFERSR